MKRIIFIVCLFLVVSFVTLLYKKGNQRNSRIVSRSSSIVNVNYPPFLSANAQIGKQYYDGNCAKCHGDLAGGIQGLAPPLVHNIYEPSHHSDMSFYLAVKNGVRSHHWNFGNMPPIKNLEKTKVAKIINYIRELQQNNGIR